MRRWLRVHRSSARSNQEWVEALRIRDAGALEDLRALLIEALLPMLRSRVPAQAAALSDDFAQESVLHIMDRVDSFRGEARFVTWAAKVAIRLALSELRRLRWKDISLNDLLEEHADAAEHMESDHPSPEDALITSERAALVHQLVGEVLTERQRIAITIVMIHGMPLEEAARRMDTNRNALYKLLHDARQRMGQALADHGLTPDDLLPDK